MPVGSTYSTVKEAIVRALQVFPDVSVSEAPPVDPMQVRGPTGSGKGIWLADAEGTYDNVVLCGQGRLDLEETYDLTVVFQALPADSSDTQLVTDRRVDEMLYDFLTVMAADPTWGIDEFVYCHTTRGGFRRFTGPFSDASPYPSRCEFDLSVEARISFT